MTSHEPWTIERITDALSTPALTQQFLGEINRAPAHQLLAVFARWQGIAESIQAAAERARTLLAQTHDDGELPGEWTDITDHIQEQAARLRARAA